MSRPHSWHSSKLTEEEAEPPANGPSLAPVWQPMHETRSKEVSGQGDQSNLHQLSSRFHSVITMERPECPSHHYPPGRLSPNTYTRGPEPLTGGSTTRDAAFSCFSSSASPPLPNAFPPTRKGTSTENIFFKGLQSEGARQAEHPRYLQPPLGNGGWERPRAEEQPASRMSLTGRSGVGPVWQVPERRKTQSSPPPPPPLRSDSFAATKVFPYSAGPVSRRRSHGKALDGQNEVNDQRAFKPHIAVTQKVPEAARQGFNSEPAKDSLYPGVVADHNHNQLHPSKLFSLSSNDVRQAQSYSAYLANHQRQYSDESTFYLHTRSVPQVKQQSVGSYYRSLQDLPTNASGRKPVRLLTASAASSSAHPSLGNSGPTRYCMSARQGGSKERQMGDLGVAHCNNGKDRSSVSSLKSSVKAKYSLPHSQLPGVDNTEHSSLSQAGKGPLHQHPELSSSGKSSRSDNGQKKGERQHTDIKRQLSAQQASDQKANLPVHQDPWVPQEDHRISPSKTPFLHSLAQESRTLVPRQPMVGNTDTTSPQDAGESGRSLVVKPPAVSITLALDPGEGKACRRGDRYATTLRNQIQQKRAQLQKSRSAATLTCGEGEEDEPEDWRSTETSAASSDGSFSNTYKDHLKEAQARVLQATSFQRRDLEPVGAETATGKGVAAGQLFRIGGRKRFPLAKRVHSFSEPDKINKLGTAEGEPHPESFRERREFFESKPAFSRPVLRSGQSSSALDQNEAGGAKARLPLQEAHLAHQAPDLDPLLGEGREQALLEQQRLGTFAEYQATWSLQRKPAAEAKTKGRYHSAENILDADVAETAVCIHERSRSSPSADTQKSSVAWRDPVINSCTTPRHALPGSSSDRGKTESNVGHQAGRPDAGLQPTEPAGNEGQARHGPGPPALPDHAADRSHTALATGTPSHSPSPGSHLPAQTPLSSASTRPGPDTTSSSASSQEFRPCAREESSSSSSLLPAPPLPLSGPGPQRDGSCAQSQGHAQSSRPRSPASLPIAPSQTPEATGARELPPPLSSSSSSSFPRLASSKMAALSLPPTDLDLLLAPSPQFEPRRITNRPPAVCAVDPFPARTENGAAEGREDTSGPPARKVPVRIVHAESSERRSSAYLAHDSAGPAPLSGPVPSSPQPPSSSLSSLFGAYMRPAAAAHRETPPAQQDVQREGVRESLEVHGTEEDAKREELARDIMGRDKALADILDQRGMKTTMDLMEGLFPQEQQLLDGSHPRRRAPAAHRLSNSSARSAEERAEMGTCAPASLVPSSSYYNTSAPKAELLIKMKDMQVELEEEEDSEEELDVDLVSKKRELISSLAQKLEVLHEARQSLQEDVEDNEALGREVEAGVQRLCQPNQLDKFRMFVGDLDKVVSLLLSLSGRLARVENALNGLEEQAAPEEKRTLTEKRALLLRQHEDARELKENLDRREQLVTQAMEAQLDARGLDDYRHFVKMKSALIIEQRKLEDKVKLGEEQLKCLLDSLPSEQRLPL